MEVGESDRSAFEGTSLVSVVSFVAHRNSLSCISSTSYDIRNYVLFMLQITYSMYTYALYD